MSSRLEDQIADLLIDSYQGRKSRGRDNRLAILHLCLFHPEQTPSARFYPDDGWYYCFGAPCGCTYSLDDVLQELGLSSSQNEQGPPGEAGLSSTSGTEVLGEIYHNTLGHPTAIYPYRFPDKTLSHYRARFVDKNGRKQLRYLAPDRLTWKRPDSFWPLYGDQIPRGLNLIACESEKAVDHVKSNPEVFEGVLVLAFTAGSATDFKIHQKTIVERLQQLEPVRILVWPDNDAGGRSWATPLRNALKIAGLNVSQVNPAVVEIPIKGGPDDLPPNYTLAEVFALFFRQPGGFTAEQIVEQTIVVQGDRFILPNTRTLYTLKPENIDLLWMQTTGSLPETKPRAQLLNQLRLKAAHRPAVYAYRRWANCDYLVWRPRQQGLAYSVSGQGVRADNDPPDAVILLPEAKPQVPVEVDESGSKSDFEELCRFFNLDDLDAKLIEGWLLSVLLDLQKPILVLRGEAGSGKTTLARLLVGLIEPCVTTLTLPSNSQNFDRREMLGALDRLAALLIDNVSHVSSSAEDILSQCVTGYQTVSRTMYTETNVHLHLNPGIVMTTISYDPTKSDLASRMAPISMQLQRNHSYISPSRVETTLGQLAPRIRGYLFNAAAYYYAHRDRITGRSPIRVGSLGDVYEVLGYDVRGISNQLALRRSDVLTENDLRYQSILNFYDDTRDRLGQDEFQSKMEEILGFISEPGLTPHALGRWLKEKQALFRDANLVVRHGRDTKGKYWSFGLADD